MKCMLGNSYRYRKELTRICNLLGLKKSLFIAWRAGTEGGGEGGREGREEGRGEERGEERGRGRGRRWRILGFVTIKFT